MNWFLISVTIALIWGSVSSLQGAKSNPKEDLVTKFESDYPVGDARWCIDRARKTNFELKRFEVLPGMGWDNLRNLPAAMVVTYNFTECRVTDDGRFLIPDNVFTIPIKASQVDSFAEIIDNWVNTSSTTSHTINVQAGLSLGIFAASGSFSYEHTNLKSKQVEDKSVTVRVQIRYKRYDARLQPDPELTPQLKGRLLEMGANIELNNRDQAQYNGQLLVRDFGTHYLTSITAGAALGKDDYVHRYFMNSLEESKTKILAAASASFFSAFSLSAKYGYSSDDKTMKSYDDHVTHSYMWTRGGPLIGANATADQWMKTVDNDLVPVDRSGEPIYSLVTEKMLPELPRSTIVELEQIVRESVELYYSQNTIRGCTKLGSPNFSFSANFDDGSCLKKATNMTFGGVFQTCSVSGQYLNKNPCSGLQQVNPLTGALSCPPHYKAVKLFTGTRSTSETERKCHRTWFFWHSCHNDNYHSKGTYTSYWCAASEHVPQDSGYLFGGLYTKTRENPATQGFSCPSGYYGRSLLTDLTVCISDDFELSAGQALPLGGFFSCQSGNPLSHGPIHPVSVSSNGGDIGGGSLNLASYVMATSDKNDAMYKRCPDGFSQHVAAVTESGCEVHYCVKSGFLSGPLTPPVKRPPFTAPPQSFKEIDNNLFLFDAQSGIWLKNEKARDFEAKMKAMYEANMQATTRQSSSDYTLSPGAAAGISVVATLTCVAIATVVIVVVQKKRKKSRHGTYRRLVEPFETSTNYGTSVIDNSDSPQLVVTQQA